MCVIRISAVCQGKELQACLEQEGELWCSGSLFPYLPDRPAVSFSETAQALSLTNAQLCLNSSPSRGSTVAQCVKLSLARLVQTLAALLLIQLPTDTLGKQQMMAPATQAGNWDGAPGIWLLLGPASVIDGRFLLLSL